MDVREKLVEILLQEDDLCERGECKDCFAIGSCYYYRVADRLIANGITVQELDGCEYCNEDSEGYRKMLGAFSLENPFHGKTWKICAGKCKPREIYFCPMCGRRLQQPPKGEQP